MSFMPVIPQEDKIRVQGQGHERQAHDRNRHLWLPVGREAGELDCGRGSCRHRPAHLRHDAGRLRPLSDFLPTVPGENRNSLRPPCPVWRGREPESRHQGHIRLGIVNHRQHSEKAGILRPYGQFQDAEAF